MRAYLTTVLLCAAAGWSQEGPALYRSNCAFCHGLTGSGGRGPALNSGRFLHGSTDEDLKRVITQGVPGTNMPAVEMEPDELGQLVRFVHELSGKGAAAGPVGGDTTRGRQVYQRSGCGGCHRIGGEGSDFGPELTRIGAGRSAAYLRESIVNPSADIPPEYEGVTIVTRDGRRITGARINEDTFTVQFRDAAQKFHMYRKSDLKETVHESKSLMPPYQLSPDDLNHLLAYLDSLRGDLKTGADVKKGEGIK